MAHRRNNENENENNANQPDNTNTPAADPAPAVAVAAAALRQRRLVICVVAAGAALILFSVLWKTFFVYVPPGKGLVVVAKTGSDLGPNQVLAKKGQKGVQEEMLGEGYHFVWPVLYTTELHDLTVIPPGKVGVVTNLGGDKPVDDRILVDLETEQGIRRYVLLPGAYRLNPYGYRVDQAERIEVLPGYVGVQRRLLGKDVAGRFAENDGEKGILRKVLQPGIYYLNPKEFQVISCEVGVSQTSYNGNKSGKDTKPAILFRAKDGFPISIECTIEWEVRPDDWPTLVADYGSFHNIERNVIDLQVEQICRDRGFNFGAEDFLDGNKREAFQKDFQDELDRACQEKKVVVRSAFIRQITIPQQFLAKRRELQLSVETQKTNKVREETAKSEAEVERQQKEIDQKVAQTKAETVALAAQIDRDTANLKELTEAEIEKTKAEYNAKIAALEAEKTRELGTADAKVKELTETAKSSLFKMRMDVFEGNGDAYLRSAAAQQLNPKLNLRIYQSGPGTFWTNLDGKGFNVMVAPPWGQKPSAEK
jgi:SPFH domain / Band 7 family